MNKSVMPVLAVFVFAMLFSTKQANSQPLPEAQNMLLSHYLVKAAVKWDVYFTIEENVNEESTNLNSSDVPFEKLPSTLKAFLSNLRRILPNFVIEQNLENPVVIHLIDKSLWQTPQYILNSRQNKKFSGSVSELIESFHLTNPNQERMVGFFSGPRTPIYRSELKFAAQDAVIRHIFSDYIPLSHFQRILWNAYSHNANGELKTWVKYYGFNSNQSNRILLRYLYSSPSAFSRGEVAYHFLPLSSENGVAALQFIENQMQQKKPLQVRWAMFWLGKHKVEKSIPVLLKYLNYEYTAVPLLDERFPAFRALKEIGAPTAKAVLEALPNETDARRLELMARIVLSVQGEAEGRKALQSTLAASKDIAQQERLKTAIKTAEGFTPTATVTFPEELRTTPPKAGATPGVN